MKLLAADTSTSSGTVALLENGTLIGETTFVSKETHNRRLLNQIHGLLKSLNWTVNDIDCFAVSIGPGSFTGIRIGLTTIKTMAWVLNKPLYGASSLDILAFPLGHVCGCYICPMIDARKKEVYYAFYEVKNPGGLRRVTPYDIGSPHEIIEKILKFSFKPFIPCGDGWLSYESIFKEKIAGLIQEPPLVFHTLRASHLGSLAYQHFKATSVDKQAFLSHDLLPLYVRPSEAELKHSERQNDQNP